MAAKITKQDKVRMQKKMPELCKQLKQLLLAMPVSPAVEQCLVVLQQMIVCSHATAESLRLAEMVTSYRLSEKEDTFFKQILRKELFKLYVTNNR